MILLLRKSTVKHLLSWQSDTELRTQPYLELRCDASSEQPAGSQGRGTLTLKRGKPPWDSRSPGWRAPRGQRALLPLVARGGGTESAVRLCCLRVSPHVAGRVHSRPRCTQWRPHHPAVHGIARLHGGIWFYAVRRRNER